MTKGVDAYLHQGGCGTRLTMSHHFALNEKKALDAFLTELGLSTFVQNSESSTHSLLILLMCIWLSN